MDAGGGAPIKFLSFAHGKKTHEIGRKRRKLFN